MGLQETKISFNGAIVKWLNYKHWNMRDQMIISVKTYRVVVNLILRSIELFYFHKNN